MLPVAVGLYFDYAEGQIFRVVFTRLKAEQVATRKYNVTNTIAGR
jgi:hypothetical protein